MSAVAFHALRLHPGDDLRGSLEDWTRANDVAAAFVAAAVGSLSVAQLRFAGRDAATRIDGPLELLVLSGTLSPDGAHLHASVADSDGRVSGGHVGAGCTIRTTGEIVVGVLPDLALAREHDPATGYRELLVRRRGDRE